MGNLTATYKAASLEELADALETRANEIEAMAVDCRTQRESLRFKAQARGMRMAARVVRNTELVSEG